MIDDSTPFGIIALIVAFAIFAGGAIMGSETSETGNIIQGRNEGIIFCSEKPKECKTTYDYLKLQEKPNE